MKLYKFRPLRDELDFHRIKAILIDRVFWHSFFWELNDPMEGVFKIENNEKLINEIFDAKSKYRICSFSGEEGYSNPILWGYYANGFRGIAIEIEVEDFKVQPVEYPPSLPEINNSNVQNVEQILTTKLINWKHENEFRSLKKDGIRNLEVGKITGIHFGNPYGNVEKKYIQKHLKTYLEYKNEIIKIVAKLEKIKLYNVKIIEGKVVGIPRVVHPLATHN